MRPVVDVVGLGPAGPELTTPAATERLADAPLVFLRTGRHPAAAPWIAAGARTCDHHYEHQATFAETYAAIVEEVVGAALANGRVAYAVPGSPLVLEATVPLLRADPRVEVRVCAGMSFLDLAWERLGIDPVAAHVRLVDAERFATDAAFDRGPLLVSHLWSKAVASEVKLAVEEFPATPVVALQRRGLADESVRELSWAEIDRELEPDHLTCLYVPALGAPVGAELAALDALVRVLRAECPWDAEQTHASLARHLIEEAHEALDAIDGLGPEPAAAAPERVAHLEEELGDVLYQVFFHCVLAGEEGLFTLADVAARLSDKLVRRHPHVFGEGAAPATSASQESSWERLKQQEKGRTSLLAGIPATLPALARAAKLEGRARSVGLALGVTAPEEGPLAAVLRASGALEREEALGAALLEVARRAADARLEPEQALRRALAAWEAAVAAAEEAAGGPLGALEQRERRARWRDAGAG